MMKRSLTDAPAASHNPTPVSDPTRPHQPTSPISSQQLFAGRQEITIAHGDGLYQLRQTRSGKLILTK